MKRALVSVMVAGLVGMSAGPVSAATLIFTANLSGAQETPPVVTAGTGSATMTVDDVTGAWSLSGSFSNLTGTSTNAHIHGPAAIGAGPAGVIKGLSFTSGVNSGTFNGSDLLTSVFTAPQLTELKNGLYYVNVHSTFAGGGELRGQLLQVPEPSAMACGVMALGGLLRRRRAAV